MSKKKKLMIFGISLILTVLIFSFLWMKYQKRQCSDRQSIGVVMWKGDLELYQAVERYVEELDAILNLDIQMIRCNAAGYMDYEKMIEDFRQKGGKVLINILTENLWEIMQVCEKNDIYLLQMWEMPEDTDMVERLNVDPYFLGYLINNEQKACNDMSKAIKRAGCTQPVILTSSYGNKNNNVHHLRNESFESGLLPNHPVISLEVSDFKDGLYWMKKRGVSMDGILSSIGFHWDSLANIENELELSPLRLACFDMDQWSEENFRSGNLVMVSCGQQNILALAVVYADAFLNGDVKQTRIELTCPYMEVTSVEEYELYEKMCVQRMPYSLDDIKKMYDSLAESNKVLREYSNYYNMKWLNAQKNS